VTRDATFEEGRDGSLYIGAGDAEDLAVVSSLVQDAVLPITEMRWDRKQRRFALLLNRFRWEDREAAALRGRAFERVQSVLAIDLAATVASQGLDRNDRDLVLSLLGLTFEAGEDGAGDIVLTFAGDGAVRISVEAIDVTLRDVTRPYRAPSGAVPAHPLDPEA
jgi:hypothetical protein